MTGVCRGGTSSAQPGFGASLYVTSGGIGGLLNNVATRWAVPLGALLSGTTFALGTLCTADPPSDPGITAADAMALLQLNDLEAARIAAGKLYQLAARTLWYQVCQCDDGLPPTALATIPPPAGLPAINPPVAPPLNALDCGHINYQAQLQGAFVAVMYPGPGTNTIGGSNGIPPNSPSTVTATITRSATSGPHDVVTFTWQWFTSTGAVARSDAFPSLAFGETATRTYTQPFNSSSVAIKAVAGDGTNLSFVTMDVQIFCGGVLPTSVQTPCCPPDTSLSLRVDQLMQMVTLIQRQLAPFGYVPGTVHAGLSGSGHFGVSGLLGAKVNITTLPGALGQSGNLPIEIFDIGWITWNTPDGYPGSVRVDHNPFLSLPARAGAYTDLAYDFHPGVVATITELKREP